MADVAAAGRIGSDFGFGTELTLSPVTSQKLKRAPTT